MPKETLIEADSAEQALFKKKLKELSGYKGRGTELISVYIPFGTDRSSVMNQLATEMGQSSNIKSPQTRKNVQSALKKISNFLKQTNFSIPNTGMAVFAGNVSPQEGRTDLRMFVVKALKQLRTKLYWCDSSFHLDPLKEMMIPTEVYCFVVMDKREATIALLVGKRYEVIGHFTSNVAGKFRAGGQCLDPETLVVLKDGNIIPISSVEINQGIKNADTTTFLIKDAPIIDKWDVQKKKVTIITKYPRFEITSSPEHVFFTFDKETDSIVEKEASKLTPKDILLMPESIQIEGTIQKLKTEVENTYAITPEGLRKLILQRKEKGLSQKAFGKKVGIHQAVVSALERGIFDPRLEYLKKYCKASGVNFEEFVAKDTIQRRILPSILTEEVAQIAGYFLGDGHYESERIGFSEQRKELAEYYAQKCRETFQSPITVKYRESKGYYQVRASGKALVRYFKENFFPTKLAIETGIPPIFLRSTGPVLGAFLKGLFDAEGYITEYRLGLGVNNPLLAKQIQLALLRFGIISSVHEYDSKQNPYSDVHRFTVDITEKESLSRFLSQIGQFTATDKQAKLVKKVNQTSQKSNVRQLLAGGKHIRKLFEQEGMNTQDFKGVTNFFRNEREMSQFVFRKQILNRVTNPELKKKYNQILGRQLLPVHISSTQKEEVEIPMVDISVENPNFFANGLLVHNSAQRFEHLREEAANDFYKSVSGKINSTLEGKYDKLKGVIVGGPGQTKHDFLALEALDYRIREKIIGTLDLSYTDESGIREIIQRSEDILRSTDLMREKQVISKFMTEVAKDGLATYGQGDVEEALNKGQVSVLILSEGIEWRIIKVKCVNCGEEQLFTIKDPKQEFDENKVKCAKCSSPVEVVEESDYLDHLLESAHAAGTETAVISLDTEEGQQFFNSFGGIGAMLRYK
jgi:peptide subunit release factor 1 (eRF1)/transcriptional regulator with XRE-family HTH domain